MCAILNMISGPQEPTRDQAPEADMLCFETLFTPCRESCTEPMEADPDIDFTSIAEVLEESELSPSAPEAHGLLCGLLCTQRADAEQCWLDQLLPIDSDHAEQRQRDRAILSTLATHTREQLDGPVQIVDVLMPEDSAALSERARALHEWVRGFLYAFGLLGVNDTGLSPQTREILQDFTELTRMDLDAIDEDEEHEQALADIIEFVRVAALLVREECTPTANLPDDGAGSC